MIFARGKTTLDMPNFYGEHTDVWTFGTAEDYRDFAGHLDRHAVGSASHTSRPAGNDTPGMDVLLLPTCRDAHQPFLVLQERVVYQKARFNMEIIIGGTPEGFAFLRDQFLQIIRTADGDPSDHIHVDAQSAILVFPTVFLNIRGPARAWSKEHLDPYWDYCIMPGSPHRLPPHLHGHMPATTGHELVGYKDLYGRFPRAEGAEPTDAMDSGEVRHPSILPEY